MKKNKLLMLSFTMGVSLSLFSYSPVSKNLENNKKALEDTITSLVTKNEFVKSRSLKNSTEDDLIIENVDEMMDIMQNGEIDFSTFVNSIYERMFTVDINSAEVQIENDFISIENFEEFDFTLNGNNLNDELNEDSIPVHSRNAKNNSVTFTGININPQTSRWVYDKFLGFADKTVNKYSGIMGLTYAALKLTAPAFVAQATATIAGIISQFTDWLAAIGPWGVVIKLVLVVFAAIAAVIIAHIIWAGANKKGFKMGLEWTGWFKAKWVYSFYA